MPVDMQRAPKIPVGRVGTDIERIEIEPLDNGFIVNCFHKQPESKGDALGGGVAFIAPKRYTFKDALATSNFVSDKLSGRPGKAEEMKEEKLPAAPPKRRSSAPALDEPEPVVPDEEDAGDPTDAGPDTY